MRFTVYRKFQLAARNGAEMGLRFIYCHKWLPIAISGKYDYYRWTEHVRISACANFQLFPLLGARFVSPPVRVHPHTCIRVGCLPRVKWSRVSPPIPMMSVLKDAADHGLQHIKNSGWLFPQNFELRFEKCEKMAIFGHSLTKVQTLAGCISKTEHRPA